MDIRIYETRKEIVLLKGNAVCFDEDMKKLIKDYPKPGESQLEEMRYFLTEVMIVRKKILNCASALEFDGDHFKDKTKIDPIKTEAQGVG